MLEEYVNLHKFIKINNLFIWWIFYVLLNLAAKGAAGSGETIIATSATSIALKLIKTRGILGLYKGTAATMLRDVSFSVIYFPLFAHLNSIGPKRKNESGEAVFWTSFLAGCGAGCIAAVAVNPFDG